jgi:CheY-like chemotaxis protein
LVTAKEVAEAANRAKSTFLATMSHEIRTPMTAILGYADLLMDPTLSASSRNNYATTIRRSGEHLLALINDILDLSKIEAGKMSLDLGRCYLGALLADVASLLRPRAEQRNISFVLEYAGPLPESITTDAARLRQAIINLAGNAIKFTERGGVRIVAAFLPDGCQGKPGVRIDVIDTGIGIGPETLPRLFRPFSQGDSSVTRKFGGTGLGLAISHHIAQSLGGSLRVNSEVGQGSTFSLTVPTGDLDGVAMIDEPAEAMHAAEEAEAWPSDASNLTGVRVLLAEDGLDNRELIQAVLQRAGALVDTAVNGRIAIEKACSQSFDLILMDMNMPEMDGYEATSLLRDGGYPKPIVALTANAMIGDNQRCRIAGCDAYLTKPIDRELLIQTIAAMVDTRAAAARIAVSGEASRPMTASASQAATQNTDAQPSSVATYPVSSQETLPEVQQALVSLFIDDPDMAPIIQRFIGRLAEQLDAMHETLAGHAHDELRRLAHKLKGAGGSYGYPQLTDACRVLEDAAIAKDVAAENAGLAKVEVLIRAIQKASITSPSTGATP